MHYCYDPDLDGPTFRKSRKVYFVDPLLYFLADAWKLGLTNIWDRSGALMTDRSFVGLILESAVVVLASRGRETYFWYSSKTKKEVDLVIKEAGKITLFDVKFSPESLPPQLGKKVESLDSGWFLQDGARIQKEDPHTK